MEPTAPPPALQTWRLCGCLQCLTSALSFEAASVKRLQGSHLKKVWGPGQGGNFCTNQQNWPHSLILLKPERGENKFFLFHSATTEARLFILGKKDI